MHLLSFSLLLYVEIIVVYYWFLAMLSHCFPGLCGITVCLTHTDGLTSEVYNPHNVILFKFADDVDANPSLCAIHFFTLDTGSGEGVKRVHSVLSGC